MGISFGNNDYGITRKEWRAIKKELKAADKADNSFALSKADYKDMKTSIKAGNLGDYLDKYGANIRNAMGLSLTGKVDGTEDIKALQQVVNDIDFEPNTDKAKVISYIKMANYSQIAKGTKEVCSNIEDVGTTGNAYGSLLGSNGFFETVDKMTV